MEGSLIELIDDYRPQLPSGLFVGVRICENEGAEQHPVGAAYLDEEVCPWSEVVDA